MESIKDKLVIIIESDGKVVAYDNDKIHADRDYIEDYADKYHIVGPTPYSIISKTNSVVFINIPNLWVYTYLPDEITKEQEDRLNSISELYFDDVKYMEVNTYKPNKEKYIFDYNDNSDIKNSFLDLLNNYYKNKEEKLK